MIITGYAIIVAGDGWNEVISVLFFIKKIFRGFTQFRKHKIQIEQINFQKC